MLAQLGEIARERGLETVEVRFVRTARNVPAQLFLDSVAGNHAAEAAGGRVYRIPAEQAAAIRHQPGGTAVGNGDGAAPEPDAPRAPRNRIDYARIAAELREPARILARVRGRAVRRAATSAPYAAPRTDLERRLAAIWEDTLGVSGAGVHDNFFDLGGHSLMAVQLMSRVRQELGVELSLEVVYGGEFTIEELAKAIELKQIEQAGGQDYEALLKEIESLSDEEVRALLQQEEGEGA
jgi:acyl carrier protein